jgi:hypothetical protein
MAGNGGARPNAGRKSKADEEKVNNIFLSALKQVYDTETDDETKIAFIKDSLLDSQRGQIFIAEHLFGKAPQEVKQTNFNIDATDLDDAEIKKIKDVLNNAY